MVPAPGRWLPRVSTVDRAWARGAGRTLPHRLPGLAEAPCSQRRAGHGLNTGFLGGKLIWGTRTWGTSEQTHRSFLLCTVVPWEDGQRQPVGA